MLVRQFFDDGLGVGRCWVWMYMRSLVRSLGRKRLPRGMISYLRLYPTELYSLCEISATWMNSGGSGVPGMVGSL